MRPFAPALRTHLLGSTVAVAAGLSLLAGAAAAQTEPAAQTLTIAPAHHARVDDNTLLKHLPAGKDELTFRGENASRTFQITMGRTEAARTTALQVALLNAVSVLPDRSAVKVAINGIVVASIPAASAEKPAIQAIHIPTGVLVPGINTVVISTALSHRVDCSVKATYELWATLDPALTGFVVPRDAASLIRSLDDLAAEPLAEDGTTRIHLRLNEGDSPDAIGNAARLVDALTRRAGLAHPIVDVGPEPGQGPGFDVVLDRGASGGLPASLTVASRSEGVTIGHDATTNRLVLVVAAGDDAGFDRTIATIAQTRARGSRNATPLDGATRRSLADLGFATENFAGRHYMASIDVNLPADFYPANDRARLLLDGAHTASLIPGSQLVFRVNGTLVSTMPLASGRDERFQHQGVDLPLRFFHPGHNDLAIEGMTSANADQQCDLTTMNREARLTIAGSSELDFPGFAHLATLPQIPAALAYDSAPDGGALNLYLPDADRGSMGAGLTVLANMALTQDRVGVPVVHLGDPSVTDTPGIVIAPADRLSDTMAATFRGVSVPVTDDPVEASAATDASPDVLGEAATANEAKLGSQLRSSVATSESFLRSRGFFFASGEQADRLPATGSTMLIAAVSPETSVPTVGGIELPQFRRDAAHWLVITGPTAATYEDGLRRLVESGRWRELGGQAVSLDVRTGTLRTLQPSRVAYVVPHALVLTDLRPILGGIVSNNIVLSIALLMALMSVLGVSTHLLVRRMGVK